MPKSIRTIKDDYVNALKSGKHGSEFLISMTFKDGLREIYTPRRINKFLQKEEINMDTVETIRIHSIGSILPNGDYSIPPRDLYAKKYS